MNLKALFLCLLSTQVLSKGVLAQVQLKANDPLIRYDLIRSGHYLSKFAVFDSTGHVTAEYAGEHVIKADTIKKDFLFVRYFSNTSGRAVVDSNWNSATGPVRYVLASYPSTRTENDIFYPTEVKAHRKWRNSTPDTTVGMASGYFDDTSIWELFGYMDLRKGVNYDMDIFGSDQRVPMKYQVEYTMDDYAKCVNGAWIRYRIFHVTYEKEDWNLWIDPATHLTNRALMENHGNGSTLVITLI
jgi:hypothetical protein